MVNPRPSWISISSRSKESSTAATSSDLNSKHFRQMSDSLSYNCQWLIPTSSKDSLGCVKLALLQNDAQILKEPVETLHSCLVTFPLPTPMRSYQGSITSGKSSTTKTYTVSAELPACKQIQQEIPKSPRPRQTHSIFFSEEVRERRELEFKGGKGKPCVSNFRNQFFKISAVCWRQTFGTWFPLMRHCLTADWLDKM